MQKLKTDAKVYANLLHKYLESDDEQYLEEAKRMSSSFVKRRIYPEEIVRLHHSAIEKLYGEQSNIYTRSLQFLLEALIAYRLADEQYAHLKQEQDELQAEIQVAANMQKTLLKTEIPQIEGLDIGAISVPYRQMNGDYYHFVKTTSGALCVAIADVIGRGVPAALAMSMIKYAMDSYYEKTMNPDTVLRNLNRVVERNVASNMFITMFYSQYFPKTNIFRFASAGHEPGFLYRAKEKSFHELSAKGLVLGVLKDTVYQQYELKIEKDDMIVLLTDGVTECRRGNRFVNREEVVEVIERYAHLSAQEHVEQVYRHFNELDDFELKDDFTLLILKKVV